MFTKLRNMIRYAKVTKAASGADNFQVQQVSYNGKLSDVFFLFPFGYRANVSKETLTAIFAIEGDNANRFAMGGHTDGAPDLAEGEVAVFHPGSGSYLKFNNDGTATINVGSNNVNIICNDLFIDGISFKDHTHPYTWTDPAGAGNTGGVNP